jgi:hypothetical protein
MGTNVRQNIVTNGLVMYLDAGSRQSYVSGSTTWTDLSGNGRTMTLGNSPTFNNTNQGFISFNGTNQFATGSAITGLGSSNRTINMWVRMDTLLAVGTFPNNAHRVFTLSTDDASTDTPAYTFNWDQGSTGGGIAWGGTPFDGFFNFNLTTGSWWNICTTITSTNTGTAYQNGIFIATKTGTGTIGANPIPQIARYSGGIQQYGNPNIGIIQIYNRILSAQEIAQNYNATKTRFGLT